MMMREARIEDAKEIAILNTQFGHDGQEYEVRKRLEYILNNENHKVIVYESENRKVLGVIHAGMNMSLAGGKYGEVFSFVVHEEFRGLGIGKKLLLAIEHWIKEHNYKANFIIIRSKNYRKQAHEFYMRHHYQVTQVAFRKTISE